MCMCMCMCVYACVCVCLRSASERTIVPTECPECKGLVMEDGANHFCTNTLSCPAQTFERLRHMCSRSCLDIAGLGPKKLQTLIELGWVRTAADVFKVPARLNESLSRLAEKKGSKIKGKAGLVGNAEDLNGEGSPVSTGMEDDEETTEKSLLDLEGWGERAVQNLIDAIERSRSPAPPLWRYINSLGIPHVGSSNAKVISKHFGESYGRLWGCLLLASEGIGSEGEKNHGYDELVSIPGFGATIIDRMIAWTRSNREACEQLARAVNVYEDPIIPAPPPYPNERDSIKGARAKQRKNETLDSAESGGGILMGKKYVVTGSLTCVTREKATELLSRLGAKVTTSVSKTTDVLLVGREPGKSKIEKATKMKVTILTELEWLQSLPEGVDDLATFLRNTGNDDLLALE
mmetsp:Transcript_13421/g.18587  ORF Transcript_13421/g.18587 Transcript_13421/m.18587 type:complete len:406 (+) Transcript_13421:1874-3091(+)